jgi:hypothetical protein
LQCSLILTPSLPASKIRIFWVLGGTRLRRNYETSEKINSDSINNILEYKDKKISTQYNRITRDYKTKELLNKIETKEFGFVYDKRVILENFDTIPFGF